MGNPSVLGFGATSSRTVINTTRNIENVVPWATSQNFGDYGFTVRRGSPVVFYPNSGDGASVIPCLDETIAAEFAGVLQEELSANILGDQTSKAIYEGPVRVNLYVPTSGQASLLKGANLYPVAVANSNSELCFCFRVVAYPTGVVLAEDLTASTRITENAVNLVDDDKGGLAIIRPGGLRGLTLLVDLAAATGNAIKTATSAGNGAATEWDEDDLDESLLTHPRNVTLTFAASTAGHISASPCTVTGYDIFGNAITDTITPTVDTEGTYAGTKAFARVTGVTIPQQDGASVTVAVGFGLLVQAPGCFPAAPITRIYKDATAETAAGTWAVDIDEPSKNTLSFPTTPNGALDMRVAYSHF
jgi:hypothetical protein